MSATRTTSTEILIDTTTLPVNPRAMRDMLTVSQTCNTGDALHLETVPEGVSLLREGLHTAFCAHVGHLHALIVALVACGASQRVLDFARGRHG